MDTSVSHVSDIMTTEVVTLDPNDTLIEPDRLGATRQIRHYPVVDDGVLVGIVSQRDIFHSALLKALGYGTRGKDQLFDTFRVKEIMTNDVVTTIAGARVQEAARLMIEHKIGCLPVLDGGALIGLVTETDLLRLIADG